MREKGYQWKDGAQLFCDKDYWNYQETVHDEKFENIPDIFADGWDPICSGDDGKLYSVMFRVSEHQDGSYWYRPVVWQEVIRGGAGMKKRIGSKLYDTDRGELILQNPITGQDLYKQPKKRSFYLFDGGTIEPLTFDQAAEIIHSKGDPELYRYLEVKPSPRGCVSVASVSLDHFRKLERYAKSNGVSMKSVIESLIDTLPEE